MKLTLTILFLCPILTAFCSDIQWNMLLCNGTEIYTTCHDLDVCIDINIKQFGGQTYMWASENDLRREGLSPVKSWNSGAWLEAYIGDLVDESTIFGHRDYWFYEMAKSQPEYGSGILQEIEFGSKSRTGERASAHPRHHRFRPSP